jgi:hypothetical protein
MYSLSVRSSGISPREDIDLSTLNVREGTNVEVCTGMNTNILDGHKVTMLVINSSYSDAWAIGRHPLMNMKKEASKSRLGIVAFLHLSNQVLKTLPFLLGCIPPDTTIYILMHGPEWLELLQRLLSASFRVRLMVRTSEQCLWEEARLVYHLLVEWGYPEIVAVHEYMCYTQWPAEPVDTPLPDLSGGTGFSLERAYGDLSEGNREKWGGLIETWLASPTRRDARQCVPKPKLVKR